MPRGRRKCTARALTPPGDYITWHERLTDGDGDQREFFRGKRMIDVINSTELRMAGVRVAVIGAFSPNGAANWSSIATTKQAL